MADIRSERKRMESELHRSSANEKIVFGKKSFSKYDEISVAETLRSSGGDMGGGSENLILVYTPRTRRRSVLCKPQTTRE